MRITISGKPGSGKSTVGKAVAKELGYKHYSTGDFMRELAVKKGISLNELSKLAEKSDEVDTLLDDRQTKLSDEDNFVLDARLGFHFVKDSYKIFLKVSIDEAVKRITGRENNSNARQETIERLNSERKRYKELYNINYEDESHYDLVIDTDNHNADEVIRIALDNIRKNTTFK